MPYYKVYFHWVTATGKVKRDHIWRVDAKDKKEARAKVIRGEKPKLIAVDRVERF